MRRLMTFLTCMATVLCLAASSAYAQHGGGAGGGSDVAGQGMMNQRQNSSVGNTGAGVTPDVMSQETPAQILAGNKKLSSAVQTLLPEGTDLQKAASSFKSLVKFVAAVHASKNLGIPFTELKSKMAGSEKLDKAIQALKPDADAKAEAKKAEKEAKTDIKDAKA
jgi:hypothetical protein